MSKQPTRMEQLGNLLTAMIAVIVSGSSSLLTESESTSKSSQPFAPANTGYIAVPKDILRQFFGAGRCKGLVTVVAQETKRPNQVVTGVLRGRMGSQMIAAALIKGISNRLGLDAARSIIAAQPPELSGGLTPDEIEEFKVGGRYHGLCSKVAIQLGTSAQTVSTVMHGKLKSKRILAALHAAMKQTDCNPPAKNPPKQKAQPFTPDVISQFGARGKYRGISIEVARSLNVQRQTVALVLKGESTSAAILGALKKAIAERDDAMDPGRLQLSAKERFEFRRGRKYNGIYTRVAKRLGLTVGSVRSVGSGGSTSKSTLAAIHKEMTRVDAELAAKTGSAKA